MSVPRGAALPPEQFERIAKALSDPRRFEILELIAGREECACRLLVDRLPVAQATVSHHLKELVVAGLLEDRQEGQAKFFRLRRPVLDAYVAEVQRRLRTGG
jgi:ArsR family transcriptional regulator